MRPPDRANREAGFVEVEPLVIGVVDLVFVIIAIAGLIVVCAGWVLGWLIQETFGRISILGYHPFGFVGNLLMDATGRIAKYLIQRVIAFAHAAWSLVCTIWRSLYVILSVFQYAFSYMDGSHQQLQQGLAAVRAQEQADISNLRTQLSQAEQSDIATVDAYIENLQSELDTDMTNLGLSVLSIESQLQGQEATDVHSLQANINQVHDTLEQQMASDVLNLNQRITSVQTVLSGAEQTDVHSLQANINTVAGSIPGVALGVVTGATPSIVAQAVAQLQPQLNKIDTDLAECLDPLCEPITPNAKQLGDLGKLLKFLLDAGMLAILAALLTEALTDPALAATEIIDAGAWATDLSVQLVDAVGG